MPRINVVVISKPDAHQERMVIRDFTAPTAKWADLAPLHTGIERWIILLSDSVRAREQDDKEDRCET